MPVLVAPKDALVVAATVMWCLVTMPGGSQAVSAQSADPSSSGETIAAESVETADNLETATDEPSDVIPVAFTKPVPESLDDLRSMETHVQSLVGKLSETTVALTVGRAQGSGVIVSEDGYVLTAAHVSGRPDQRVRIRLSDGTMATGRSLGRNRTLDASVVKIESPKRKWPFVPMAGTDEFGIGDWSIVMGHPGGYQKGRPPVVRLGRVISIDRRAIQTDNELVGGDSGGPLFDMYGRVIGINSRIGQSTTYNLHTPIQAYSDVWDELVAGEDFILHSGALLGVRGEKDVRGLRLTKVWPEEAAGKAGIQEGDVLLTFDSRRVRDLDHLVELVGSNPPGRRVTLTVLRDDRTLEFTLRLGKKPAREE